MKTKTPEEFKAEIFKILSSNIFIVGAYPTGTTGMGRAAQEVSELFKEYALSLLPSDEEIFKESKEHASPVNFECGAKWLKQQILNKLNT